MQYWLYIDNDAGDTLNLDDGLNELSLGGNKRRFQFLDYAGQNGAALRGNGSYGKKDMVLTRTETAENGDYSAWNSKRNDFMKFFTVPAYVDEYMYCQNGEQTLTLRTLVNCSEIPADKYSYIRISGKRTFKITAKSGVWEDTVLKSGNVALTSDAEQQTTITNDGLLETPMIISYTPTANETEWRVKIFEGWGIRFGGSFEAGVEVAYNMKTGKMTIGGAEVNAAQYITAGSPFQIPQGSTIAYIKASGAGDFDYSFNERYI